MEPNVFIFPGELISSKRGRKLRAFNHRDKKTSKVKRCFAPVKGDLAEEDEKRIRKLIQDNPDFVYQWKLALIGKRFPVRIKFMIYRKSHRRTDFINIIQNLCDCLVKEGLLPDDDMRHLIPVFEEYRVDKDNPRTEITIL